MSTPKTLLQMAGASLEPGKFSESAVVIIDAQKHQPAVFVFQQCGHIALRQFRNIYSRKGDPGFFERCGMRPYRRFGRRDNQQT